MTGGQRLIERNRGLHPARVERRERGEVRVEDGEGRSLIIHSNQLDITIQPEEIDLLLKSDHQGSGAILETAPSAGFVLITSRGEAIEVRPAASGAGAA